MSASIATKRLVTHVSARLFSSRPAVSYDATQLHHMKEECIAVNEQDEIFGRVSKRTAHEMPGLVLHRAFSVFAFTPQNKLILQRRSDAKITFPKLWTNTCCSHPLHNDLEMNGEVGVKRAAVRKLNHELGIEGLSEAECQVVGRYLYKAEMSDSLWGEHELDYAVVIRGLSLDRLSPNSEEVSEVEEVDEAQLKSWMKRDPTAFSPWFSLFFGFSHLSNWWNRLDSLSDVRDMNIVRLN